MRRIDVDKSALQNLRARNFLNILFNMDVFLHRIFNIDDFRGRPYNG